MFKHVSRPSPAFVLALTALFVSLSGTAIAAGIVPLAKRALTADNAKKLGGQSMAQVVASASAHATDSDHLQGQTADQLVAAAQTKSAAGFFTLKQGMFSMPTAPGFGKAQVLDMTLPCDAGQKAISGGSQWSQSPAIELESRPAPDGSAWKIMLDNPSDHDGAFGNLFVVCVS